MGRAFEYRKERKFRRWSTMAKVFTKLGREISIAVRDGGPEPEANPKLRMLMQNAKAANMPKDNVERAIKKASGKDNANYKEVVYEGYGPYGIAVIIETATDNPTRTVANIRSYFNKCGGSLGTAGSVDFMFDHKCHFKVHNKGGVDIEELELELIDYGVEDIFLEEGFIIIYGQFESYGPLQNYLEENGYSIENSGFERIPHNTKQLNQKQREDVEKLLTKIEEDDDVTNLFHNVAG
ncbi:YebC/PmpR family DNA-binding transcriptional regulator [Marinilabiliaceae bacterium ANBcel2]|nr:YebC/PmpR family DNA-binding transcriptional regulator [Marinilabiliaceae bacterium ANBcel2]